MTRRFFMQSKYARLDAAETSLASPEHDDPRARPGSPTDEGELPIEAQAHLPLVPAGHRRAQATVGAPRRQDGRGIRCISSAGRPAQLVVPDHYEPGYPYPLIVWLHGRGKSERELAELLPRASERNFLGLAFRGPLPTGDTPPHGYRWPQSALEATAFESELYDTACRLRRAWHVHSERIYLAGFDDGGTMCLRLLLARPEWFAGAVAFSSRFPAGPHALARYRDLTGKRVLVGTGARSHRVGTAETARVGRLLHAAGMEVATRTYDAGHEVTDEMLADLNRWVMQGVCAGV